MECGLIRIGHSCVKHGYLMNSNLIQSMCTDCRKTLAVKHFCVNVQNVIDNECKVSETSA